MNSKYTTIKFVKNPVKNPDYDEIKGVDGKVYKIGLGKVATLPEPNAQVFVKRGVAVPVDISLNSNSGHVPSIEKEKNSGGELKVEIKSKSQKYLAGYIDMGIFGKKEVYLFKNRNKGADNVPAFRAMVKENGDWKEIGAFWVREKKSKNEADEIMEG